MKADSFSGFGRVACTVCGEWLVPVGNGTFRHRAGYRKPGGHEHAVRAWLVEPPWDGEGQGQLGFEGQVNDGSG